ncbi:MAG: DNA cytosine methyltransferase, partial [Cytophagales bacterium]|nr:DNA cytosine methyltransferase [Cytophagales bacterium]
HQGGYVGHKDVYGRIRLAQPGPTMTAGCFNPSKGRFLHPWKNHGITIRHAARFQTFPDNYIFAGGITSQGAQVGNAVPIILGEAMITETIKCIENCSVDKSSIKQRA